MPEKLTYYESVFNPGMAIYVTKVKKRDANTFELNVQWFEQNKVSNRYLSMGIIQDIVVKGDTFESEWKRLNL